MTRKHFAFCAKSYSGAVSNWKDNTEEYQKIQGILIDVKTLMSINVRQEMKEIEKLAKLIEN